MSASPEFRYYCLDKQPAAPHRCCRLIYGHAGDHASLIDGAYGPVVVASWPGVNSKYQTGPDRTVQL